MNVPRDDMQPRADERHDPDRMSLEASQLPAKVAAFRREYQREHVGPRYPGWGHFALTSIGSLGAIAIAIAALHDVRPWEWLTVPASFVFANFGEYLGHRGPMHHPRRGLGILYERHTRQHHRYFTGDAMACETPRDFKMILFPPAMLLFFLGLLAVPIGLLLFVVVSANVGWLFVATAVAYFLTYEWLHFAYHQPPGSLIGRLPGIATLRWHHTVHHDPGLMGRYNFNITFPICDRLFGTYHRDARPQ